MNDTEDLNKRYANLVKVVLLFEPHAHLFEILSVGEHHALSIPNFVKKHLNSFGLLKKSCK